VHSGVLLLELTDTRSSSISTDASWLGEAPGTESESAPRSSNVAAVQRCCSVVRTPVCCLGVDEELVADEEPRREFDRVLA